MKFFPKLFLLLCFSVVPLASNAQTQQTPAPGNAGPSPAATPRSFGRDLLRDQGRIWTAPFHLHKSDAKWLVPLTLATAGLIASDRHTSGEVSRNGSLQPVSHAVSLPGSLYASVAGSAGLYLIGRSSHHERAAKTGRLMAEALIDTAVVTEVFKFAAERARPNEADGRGRFFTHGRSFPSGHSSAVWASATVVALQYKHSPWIRYGAIAAAAAIAMSRYSGRKHFLSDVLAGGALGYGIGQFVYTEHR